MPTIQQYGDPKVQSRVIQGPRANELPASAFPATHVATALDAVGKAAEQIQDRINTTNAEETLVNFERQKNDMLFNPKTGYFNTQGKDAFDKSTNATNAVQKLMHDHADKLTNPQARDAFMRVANQHTTSAIQSINMHASKGFNAWEVATTKAQIENTIENAALYRGDPKKLAVQRELGRQSVFDVAKREGIDGDALNERLQTFDSVFASATISAAISDGAAQGKEALLKYNDMLEEPDRLKLKDDLEKKQKSEHSEGIANIGQKVGRSITDQFYSRGVDAARAEVDKLYKDPEINRAVTNEVLAEFRRKDYAQQRKEVEAANAADDYLMGGGTEPRTVNGFKASHPSTWAAMTPKQQRAFESGQSTLTDQKTLLDIKSMSMDEKATLNVSDYTDRLSVADRKDVLKMVEDARAGKNDIELQGDAAFTNAKLKQYGLNDEDHQAVLEAVNAELNKAVATKGEALTSKDKRNIITNTLSEFVIEKPWWPDKTYDVKNTPVPELRAMNLVRKQIMQKLPGEDQNDVSKKIGAVRDALIERGLPVNRDTIITNYLSLYPVRRQMPSRVNEIPK